jgi:hypothetical protein
MIFVLMMAAIVWITSNANSHNGTAASVLFPILLCLLAFTIIDLLFFFLLPAIICFLAALLISISIFQLRKQPKL